MTEEFRLDPLLAADTAGVSSLTLCDVLVMKDANYPWLILVPRRPGAVEVIDLDAEDQQGLIAEISSAAEILRDIAGCHKLNIAALGNQVRQLHVHIIARHTNDAAWPNPVWGAAPRKEYQAGVLEDFVIRLRQGFGC